jgi:alkanesulfonate monooxygenase SsuD/methylene tetrahydromethanopterin reductase-like flavin-dependent oxidoreductase (luciferase family)
VLGSASSLSPLETMTYAAACTERLRLGCAVFVTPLHQPVHLAKSVASLDQLSRGRLEVGVGIGGRRRPLSAFEVEPDDGLVARFNEGLALMRALWTESTITVAGQFWQLDREAMESKPFQKPHPPAVVRRWQCPIRPPPGSPARRRLLRRRVHDDRGVRRTGLERAALARTA